MDILNNKKSCSEKIFSPSGKPDSEIFSINFFKYSLKSGVKPQESCEFISTTRNFFGDFNFLFLSQKKEKKNVKNCEIIKQTCVV